MKEELKVVKTGLFLVMLTLIFGISLGTGFGVDGGHNVTELFLANVMVPM